MNAEGILLLSGTLAMTNPKVTGLTHFEINANQAELPHVSHWCQAAHRQTRSYIAIRSDGVRTDVRVFVRRDSALRTAGRHLEDSEVWSDASRRHDLPRG